MGRSLECARGGPVIVSDNYNSTLLLFESVIIRRTACLLQNCGWISFCAPAARYNIHLFRNSVEQRSLPHHLLFWYVLVRRNRRFGFESCQSLRIQQQQRRRHGHPKKTHANTIVSGCRNVGVRRIGYLHSLPEPGPPLVFHCFRYSTVHLRMHISLQKTTE